MSNRNVTIQLKRVKQLLAVSMLTAVSSVSLAAAPASIKSVRLWHAPDYTRLVFDLSAGVQHNVQQLENPNRVVLDLKGLADAKAVTSKKITDSRVKSVHADKQKGGDMRLVLDTSNNYRTQAFVLPPNGSYGHRLVVDLYDAELMSDESAPAGKSDAAKAKTEAVAKTEAAKNESKAGDKKAEAVAKLEAAKSEPVKNESAKVESAKAAIEAAKALEPKSSVQLGVQENAPTNALNSDVGGRAMIIAIDAGHGGDDPGATGKRGTREKNVTLAIARKLYARMQAEPGIKPVMTRTGDYFVPLDKRRQIARDRYKADLFISIHADALRSGSAYGASVYAISRKGATSAMAARLADSENRADVVGGVSAAGKDDLLKTVLVDLSMDGTMEHSLRVGKNVLGSLGSVGRLHRRNVEQAGFVVLKTPDMPSILVETGFISTPEEEVKLNSVAYQEQLSNAITSGVRRYFASNPIPGSYFASLRKSQQRASVDLPVTAVKQVASAAPAAPVKSTKNTPRQLNETRHLIGAGETLTSIAKKYRVSPEKIRNRNGMKNDIVQVGRTIEIPNT